MIVPTIFLRKKMYLLEYFEISDFYLRHTAHQLRKFVTPFRVIILRFILRVRDSRVWFLPSILTYSFQFLSFAIFHHVFR